NTPTNVEEATTIDVVVARLGASAAKTRQIWLPPLPDSLGLEQILGRIQATSHYGLRAERDGYLRVRLGLQDKPIEQWQGPLILDLSGPGGNIGIVGSPQTGKTTTLRTLVVSIALTHSPAEVNMYIIDMSGSSLRYLEQLPHVGAVTSHLQEEKLTRLVAEMRRLLEERERIFSSYHLDGIEQMRRMHREGQLPDIVAADVLLLVDGWASFRKDFDQLADIVQDLAFRGLGFGIHVVLSSGRWADFRLPLQGVLGTKLELSLNDPFDSFIGRKTMEAMKGAPAGRMLTPDRLCTQVCMPTVRQANAVSGETPEAIVTAIASEWRGVQAPAIRLLPDKVLYQDLRTEFAHVDAPMIGLNEIDLGPACLNIDKEHRHLMVIGDGQTGKTSTLHVLIHEIAATSTPEEAMVCVFDLRRSLLGAVPDDYLGEYAGTVEKAKVMVQALCHQLTKRIPPTTVTIEQLRTRSWWSGPEIYVVVDDFDMLEGEANPLRPLIPFIAQASDLGLHMIVARRSAGVGRAAYESVFRALKDAGAAGVLCSGDRQEGQIWPGVTMQKLPQGRALWVDRTGRKSMVQLAYFNDE
ncbi:MAG: type VII secretion protein EccCb, partial [Corynebacterium sp.]|nr:type VII secretion protein EccCb [Corynebacterium sp.]